MTPILDESGDINQSLTQEHSFLKNELQDVIRRNLTNKIFVEELKMVSKKEEVPQIVDAKEEKKPNAIQEKLKEAFT